MLTHYLYHHPNCTDFLVSHNGSVTYRARDSDSASTSETTGEITDGDANPPDISQTAATCLNMTHQAALHAAVGPV